MPPAVIRKIQRWKCASDPEPAAGGFFVDRTSQPPVLADMRDWIGFAMSVYSFILPFLPFVQTNFTRPRQRIRERSRTLKIGNWIEWTSHYREDHQS